MPDDTAFASLVKLACHDVRTPLATVYGFARTLHRVSSGESASRYVSMIEAAAKEITEILDALAVAARIESGTYDPVLEEVDTLALVHAAAERNPRIEAVGLGAQVTTDPPAVEGALLALASCAARHGGIDELTLTARGAEIDLRPVLPEAAPIVLGQDLKDLGSAVALRVVAALGGSVSLEGEALVVGLPAA